jgi:hypothetical protein
MVEGNPILLYFSFLSFFRCAFSMINQLSCMATGTHNKLKRWKKIEKERDKNYIVRSMYNKIFMIKYFSILNIYSKGPYISSNKQIYSLLN